MQAVTKNGIVFEVGTLTVEATVDRVNYLIRLADDGSYEILVDGISACSLDVISTFENARSAALWLAGLSRPERRRFVEEVKQTSIFEWSEPKPWEPGKLTIADCYRLMGIKPPDGVL